MHSDAKTGKQVNSKERGGRIVGHVSFETLLRNAAFLGPHFWVSLFLWGQWGTLSGEGQQGIGKVVFERIDSNVLPGTGEFGDSVHSAPVKNYENGASERITRDPTGLVFVGEATTADSETSFRIQNSAPHSKELALAKRDNDFQDITESKISSLSGKSTQQDQNTLPSTEPSERSASVLLFGRSASKPIQRVAGNKSLSRSQHTMQPLPPVWQQAKPLRAGLKPAHEQLPLSRVKAQPYVLHKDEQGFCHLQDFELTGPLRPAPFLYEGFLSYTEETRFPSMWHREKLHMVHSSKVAYIIPPKSWSTSVRNLLAQVGLKTKDKFELDFPIQTWWNQTGGQPQRKPFLEWFRELHGHKRFFSTIREPYDRIDSGIGTMMNREGGNQTKQRLTRLYCNGQWLRTAHHIYPQSHFYSHAPNVTLFLCGPGLETKLKAWLGRVYPSVDLNSTFFRVSNAREGPRNGLDISLVQDLVEQSEFDLLRDYVFDETLWLEANHLQC